MTEWGLPRHRELALSRCGFWRDNHDPSPIKHDCPRCECDEDYSPTIECGRPATYRVQLADDLYYEACSPDAHGHPVLWAAELYCHPEWVPTFDQILRRHYTDTLVYEIAKLDSAL